MQRCSFAVCWWTWETWGIWCLAQIAAAQPGHQRIYIYMYIFIVRCSTDMVFIVVSFFFLYISFEGCLGGLRTPLSPIESSHLFLDISSWCRWEKPTFYLEKDDCKAWHIPEDVKQFVERKSDAGSLSFKESSQRVQSCSPLWKKTLAAAFIASTVPFFIREYVLYTIDCISSLKFVIVLAWKPLISSLSNLTSL